MQNPVEIRPAAMNDFYRMANLINSGSYVHRHLDWRIPLEWLGSQPFWLLEENQRTTAALACPTDIPDFVWVRLFAAQQEPEEAWEALFEKVLIYYEKRNSPQIGSLSLNDWYTHLLLKHHFKIDHSIISLNWSGELPAQPTGLDPDFTLRSMTADDLEQVVEADHSAFEPIWQLSKADISRAFDQAVYATVIEAKGKIAGYQICTGNIQHAHLARLAIHQEFQHHHLGAELAFNLLENFKNQKMELVTVNTQTSNTASRALYKKMNFFPSLSQFPVFIYHF